MGSFLRPPEVHEARRAYRAGQIPHDELRATEDKAIRGVVARQEEVGLRGITDGEFRRAFFHVDFLEQLDGVTVTEG
ncbi:MAG: 5-methyltetrahydropteroyltriglutamate--homocysteine S-methyltransferase, partial [Acidimicrobiia bacterium]